MSRVTGKRPLEGIRILLVEDDRDSLELLELFLTDEGASVTSTETAAQARAAFATRVPDVMISDLSLPDEDGYALLASFRADPARSRIPAIALTGHAEDDAILRSVKAGFNKHIAKPVDLVELSAALVSLSRREEPFGGAPVDSRSLRENLASLIAGGNLRELLAQLNAASTFRFSSIVRLDGDSIVPLAHFDRETLEGHPPLRWDLAAEAHRLFQQDRRAPVVIEDARTDGRLLQASGRDQALSHCGVPLVRMDGTVFGWLCHYDSVSRVPGGNTVALMERVARLLRSELSAHERPK